jgi:four helix bundle protein
MSSRSFEDVIVWQKAHKFVLNIYKITEKFPKNELYCLTSQFRRAALSIPANISEGFRRKGNADKLKYYNIAESSLSECYYYLILAEDLKYGEYQNLRDDLNEISKILFSYSNSIRNSK